MENGQEKKLNGHVIRRIAIAVFCVVIGVCVLGVMLYLYDPAQNTLRALSSVCMDIVCICILFVLIGSFAFGDYSPNRTTRLFALLLVATVWALFTDFLNWAFDGALEFWHMTYWFTVGSLCMGSILACILSLYLYCYMEDTHDLRQMRKPAIVCAIINLISFIITFSLALTGTAFEFVNGHYETGELYDIVTALPIFTLLVLTGYIIRYVKTVGVHDALAAVGYMLFMITGALIEAENSVGTTYVAVTIADVFIFVMLQNEIIATEKQNVKKWMIKSHTDALTGFYNRSAYEADLKILENGNLGDDFVFILADVNSLKSINDSFGHNAGDELIIGAAECLEKSLGSYGKLYRIGGDEFIALIFAGQEDVEIIKKNIETATQEWRGKLVQDVTLSCGFVTKKEVGQISVKEMAVLADKRMYEAKNEYYRITGIERRKQ